MTEKQLPEILYVKIENEGKTSYFVADKEPAALVVEMDQEIKMGVYKLVKTQIGKGIVQITREPARK